ncbi:uncharacterized protein DUF4199 [Gelidibacter algens]|jgi:hypothetical protein|uniref:Uncharacterized protein DUF4199 n=1 Tax=Gelidibacter algens TaxID=49280 RepID=A0A1A7QZE3_9FLAO|nr:DUF4199 domain-containing protein [Gelidibacter algens]OBX24589.1 hypothetical protein A9996_14255 [Gelidibacter algens]RAJ27806.1 uncharacterized protein DUF4199 [Gelidibacter algens]
METQKLAPGKFAINYGVILGLVMVVISVIAYVTGLALEGAQWPTAIYYIIFPVVIFYAISQYKKRNASLLTLSEALKVGVLIGVISAIVFVIYSLIFNYIIDPDFVNQMKDVARDNMLEQNPDMTQEMVDQGMKFVEMFTNPAIMGAFWIALSALFGLIYALIGGLIMKKETKLS